MEKKAAHPKRKTVAQIKQELLECGEEQREALMAFYSQDDRKGVMQCLRKAIAGNISPSAALTRRAGGLWRGPWWLGRAFCLCRQIFFI